MRFSRLVATLMTLGLFLSLVTVDFGGVNYASADGGYTRNITASGSANLASGVSATGTGDLQGPEFGPALPEADQNGATGPVTVSSKPGKAPTNRSNGNGRKHNVPNVPVVAGSTVANANPNLVASTDGINFYQNRYVADGGNQFSVEPPDQGLCVGNGYILESVNDSIGFYSTSGTLLTYPGTTTTTTLTSLNKFYNYPSAFHRPFGPRGPQLTDPTCLFDSDTGRFFHVVLTLDTDTDGNYLGSNHLDLAVSKTSNPLLGFTIFKIPVQDDGTQGTPNHGCMAGPDANGNLTPGPCLGDYPHIGADAYGIYITTNEYEFFGNNYIGAQLYALSKRQLAAAATNSTVKVVQFDTSTKGSNLGGNPGFTVWPATAPNDQNLLANGGTEFFLSSTAGDEAGGGYNGTNYSNNIGLWGLTNTSSLDSANPDLFLTNQVIYSEGYGFPPLSNQKAGNYPLGQCISNPDCSTTFLGVPTTSEVEGPLDSNDTRMQQVTYANGLLYGALDTIVNVAGQDKAGIAYFIVKPVVIGNGKGSKIGPQSDIVKQGYVAVAGNNVIYPAIGVLNNGKGIMAFTLVGSDYYPSAAYTSLDLSGTGPIHVAAAGLGPQDGFSEYKAYSSDGVHPRPRWGDYGATSVVGNTIYFATVYIGQTCDLATYRATRGRCGNTRGVLGNWYTRISSVNP